MALAYVNQNGAVKAKSTLNIVLGAMTIGDKAFPQARIHTLPETQELLDTFQSHGHREIDTSRYYGGGTSEQYLAKASWSERGLVMDTKYYPTRGRNMPGGEETTYSSSDLRKYLKLSLEALSCDKVDMWYLHGPDRTSPILDTLFTVNELYKEGHFARFGISNYQAWEVAQINELCIQHSLIRPCAYQGVYNALHRSVEPELFPCLRNYGMAFYAYNPLAGGYLTDRYRRDQVDSSIEAGSRFDPNTWQGKGYRARYWTGAMFDALELLRPVAEQHGLTVAETALRWLAHHSQLSKEHGVGDAVIIGASSSKQLEQNLVDLEKDELPQEVVKALDQGWEKTRGGVVRYWH